MTRDSRHKGQNSGVTLVSLAECYSSIKDKNPIKGNMNFHGNIIEIIEVDYYAKFKFVLFHCEWYTIEEDKYGLVLVNFARNVTKMIHLCWLLNCNSVFILRIPALRCRYTTRGKL